MRLYKVNMGPDIFQWYMVQRHSSGRADYKYDCAYIHSSLGVILHKASYLRILGSCRAVKWQRCHIQYVYYLINSLWVPFRRRHEYLIKHTAKRRRSLLSRNSFSCLDNIWLILHYKNIFFYKDIKNKLPQLSNRLFQFVCVVDLVKPSKVLFIDLFFCSDV